MLFFAIFWPYNFLTISFLSFDQSINIEDDSNKQQIKEIGWGGRGETFPGEFSLCHGGGHQGGGGEEGEGAWPAVPQRGLKDRSPRLPHHGWRLGSLPQGDQGDRLGHGEVERGGPLQDGRLHKQTNKQTNKKNSLTVIAERLKKVECYFPDRDNPKIQSGDEPQGGAYQGGGGAQQAGGRHDRRLSGRSDHCVVRPIVRL